MGGECNVPQSSAKLSATILGLPIDDGQRLAKDAERGGSGFKCDLSTILERNRHLWRCMLSAESLVDVTDQIQPARLALRALAYGGTFRGQNARVGSLVVARDSVGKGDAVRAGSGAMD
jgi:hypothetical protein